VVAHRWLQRIAEEGLAAWSEPRVQGLEPRVVSELERRGVPAAERAEAVAAVLQALSQALADEHGRWILGAHPEAANEMRVQYRDGKRIRLAVMDRVFTTETGERWVVDYKTGRHEGGGEEAFLDRERERYADQLRRYARVLDDGRRLGLFFPLVPGWREVE
jgi:ATP-dependent exoDNAse (exonuclease V) beta subunit